MKNQFLPFSAHEVTRQIFVFRIGLDDFERVRAFQQHLTCEPTLSQTHGDVVGPANVAEGKTFQNEVQGLIRNERT